MNGNGLPIPHTYEQFALKFTFKLAGAQHPGVLGVTERNQDPDYPDIPSQIQYSAINVDNCYNLSPDTPEAPSLYQTVPDYKIRLLKTILSHEIFHALHVCHSIPSTEPPESFGDNADIDPAPVYPPVWDALYIMQSGGRFYNYLIDSIANTSMAVPQDYHLNSIRQVRFHDMNLEAKDEK